MGTMPFTPTHVLAILPVAAIKRQPLPFSALVIGSMIPDLPLFLPWSPGYGATHSAPGLVTACLPLGLACFLLFQLAIKRPLFAMLPAAVQSRCVSLMVPRLALRPGLIAWACLAVVVGASTHVFWDSFTHRGRWGTHLVHALYETVPIVGGYAIPGYKLLQYGSTLIRLPCLALLLGAWLYRQTPEPVDEELALVGASKVAVCLAVLAIPISVGVISLCRGDLTGRDRLGSSITTSGLALMITTLVYCLAYNGIGSRLLRRKSLRGRSEIVSDRTRAARTTSGSSGGSERPINP